MPGARHLASSLLKEMKDLKNLFICIADPGPLYLDELMTELNDNGVRLISVEPGRRIPDIPLPACSYTLTDNESGVEFACRYNTGFVLYKKPGMPCSTFPSSASSVYSEAQCIIEGFDEISADFIEKMYQRKNHIPWTIAETERTIIRELCEDDIDDLFSLYDDTEIRRFIPPLLPTRSEELEFQKAYIDKMYGFFGYGFWNICDRDTGILIGRAGLNNRKGFDTIELGYLLKEDFRGKGIAFEVCSTIISYAENILGVTELISFIQKENLPSIRLSEKLGFKDTGETVKGHNDKILSIYKLTHSKVSVFSPSNLIV